jgi:hypothetical protein
VSFSILDRGYGGRYPKVGLLVIHLLLMTDDQVRVCFWMQSGPVIAKYDNANIFHFQPTSYIHERTHESKSLVPSPILYSFH